METVLIVIHLMVVVALIAMVLLQRSEGGALGMGGGGGGGGGFMSARGAANALTRTTGFLAAAFFATSIGLSVLAKYQENPTDVLNQIPVQSQGGESSGGGILDQLAPQGSDLGSDQDSAPTPEAVPDSTKVPTGN